MKHLMYLMCLFVALTVTAQDEDLRKQLEDLKRRVDELEKSKQETKYPTAKLLATLWLYYQVDTRHKPDSTRNQTQNKFDLERIYFGMKGDLSADDSYKIVLEGRRHPAPNPELQPDVKYAFISHKFSDSLKVNAGFIPLPYVPYIEALPYWGYRNIGSIMLDREGYMTSADIGAGIEGRLGNSFTFSAAVVNGETWISPEVNKYKSFDTRLSYFPVKSVQLGVYEEWGWYAKDQPRTRLVPFASLVLDNFRILGEFGIMRDRRTQITAKQPSLVNISDTVVKGSGYALYSAFGLGAISESLKSWEVLARWDTWNPSVDAIAHDTHTRVVTGISYKLTDNSRLVLDWDNYNRGKDARFPAPGIANTVYDESVVRLTWDFSF